VCVHKVGWTSRNPHNELMQNSLGDEKCGGDSAIGICNTKECVMAKSGKRCEQDPILAPEIVNGEKKCPDFLEELKLVGQECKRQGQYLVCCKCTGEQIAPPKPPKHTSPAKPAEEKNETETKSKKCC